MLGKAGDVAGAIAHLKAVLGAQANDSAVVREHHSHGESYHPPAAPDVVCFPRTTDEVVEILRASQRFRVPVVPFGAGILARGARARDPRRHLHRPARR